VKYLADPSTERRSFVAKNFPETQVVTDWREVLADSEVDAVIIATPAGTHYSLAIAAL
jgi:predicted dehydrogenase